MFNLGILGLNKFAIGGVVLLGLYAGWQKIKVVGLEKDLIVITQSRDSWKASDAKLRVKVTQVEASAKKANDLNNEYLKTVRLSQHNYLELQQELKNVTQKSEEISRIFAEHDFEFLLMSKPSLMQRRIRNGTKRLFESFKAEGDPTGTSSGNN